MFDFLKAITSIYNFSISNVKKINSLFDKKQKISLIILIFISIFVSFIELLGIGIIMPFIEIATDFSKIKDNAYLVKIYEYLHFTNYSDFVIFLGMIFIFFYIFRGTLNLFYYYLITKFSENSYYLISYKLFYKYLNLRYIDFINKNSSNLLKNITIEAQNLVQIIFNTIIIITEIMVVILIYIFLLYVNWKITLVLTLFLGINLLIFKKIISPIIKKSGIQRYEMQRKFYELLSKSFGNYKYIKLRDKEKYLLDKFSEFCFGYTKANILSNTLSHFPRLFLETIGFVIVISVLIYSIYSYKSDVKFILPTLSAFVLGLYRLLPSINRIYASYNRILFYLSSLDSINNDLSYSIENLGSEAIDFKNKIILRNIYFEYRKNKPVLKNINLTIKKGEKIGIIGKSGSGKSTLIDIIIGLYKPTHGEILIDGIKLNENNIKNWRNKIGYVPQHIYLFDGTIAENISLEENFNEKRIKEVLKMVNLLDFLEKNHEGIYTKVGEHGVKLSGGQKQRVAIARALYNNPEILVLDEATSSLDYDTEFKIMEEIYKISKDKTLIIVAHRISTLEKCDRIIKIGNGIIIEETTYNELIKDKHK